MTRDELIQRIREQRPALEAAGAKAVYLFGSFARGDNDDFSDVDVAIDIDREQHEHFSVLELVEIKHIIQAATDRETDVLVREDLRTLKPDFEAEHIGVF
ncbi:MAG: nucleotidyltransferase domain-containing protein [Pseudomonadota bacterium]